MTNIERLTGLNRSEIDLVTRCFNGIELGPAAVPERNLGGVLFGRDTLISEVAGETSNAHEDLDKLGYSTDTLSSDAEQPYRLEDVLEKLRSLSDRQAECLLYYIAGRWDAYASS